MLPGGMVVVVVLAGARMAQSTEGTKVAEDAAKRQRAADGSEGILFLGDRATGQGISFVLWRDEQAMKADLAKQEQEISAAKATDPSLTIGDPTVYEVLARA